LALCLLGPVPVQAQDDAEGCKDHPMFTRMPNTYIEQGKTVQFDMRGFPVGPPIMTDNNNQVTIREVEGPVYFAVFRQKDGVSTLPSGLQILRNFESATKKAGGTVEGSYPGWCKAGYDPERMPMMGNGCMSYGLTARFVKGEKETWLFLQANGEDGSYLMTVSEREAMRHEVSVNEMADTLTKDGFLTLYVNFDTGKATIKPDSEGTLDAAAGALKAAGDLKVEVGGHTDNVGLPEANQKLSEQRAQAVMAALVQRGVSAARLTAKGYGQAAPIADNRTEDGRAKNRRVELVKK
jgi:outer membrane protein OmpA-like peptidoglycan-associated protein